MAFADFIPEIWNSQLLLDFRERATAAALANTAYEGDARLGNKVKITTIVDVAIKDYATGVGGNARTTEPDDVDVTQQELDIDQEKNFDFLIDDIDRRQAAGSLEVYTQSAGIGFAEDADQFLLALAHTGAAAANQQDGAGDAPATADEAFDVLADLRKALNQANAPRSGRVAFVNAEFARHLYGADAKFTEANTSGTTQGLREAILGRVLGFDIIETENLPETDEEQVVALWAPALAFVSQMQDTEPLRDTDSFSDRLRGLHVYGGKVIRPTAVATWDVGTA